MDFIAQHSWELILLLDHNTDEVVCFRRWSVSSLLSYFHAVPDLYMFLTSSNMAIVSIYLPWSLLSPVVWHRYHYLLSADNLTTVVKNPSIPCWSPLSSIWCSWAQLIFSMWHVHAKHYHFKNVPDIILYLVHIQTDASYCESNATLFKVNKCKI